MIRETISVWRDLGRLREIAGILMHYGWGDIVKRLGLGRLTRRAGEMMHRRPPDEIMHLPPEVRVRLALQDWTDLRQAGAGTGDAARHFPPRWIAEFFPLG